LKQFYNDGGRGKGWYRRRRRRRRRKGLADPSEIL
jgi:hypothetical protein